MRTSILLLLLLPLTIARGQDIQRWDVQNKAWWVQMHMAGDGAVGIEQRTEQYDSDWWTDIYASLYAYVPEESSTATPYQLWPREYYYSWEWMEGTEPGFSWDVTRAPGGDLLAAVGLMDIFWTDVGCRVDSVRAMKLMLLKWGTASEMARIPGAVRPQFFTTRSGDTWLAWEQVVNKNVRYPDEMFHWVQDYEAEIHVARLRADFTPGDEIVVGKGHTPRWVESASGDLYLLRRRIDYAGPSSRNDLLLTQITPLPGADLLLDTVPYLQSYDYHGELPGAAEHLSILAGPQGDFHVVCPADSLLYVHVSPAGDVESQRRPQAFNTRLFTRETDGVPMLFWRSTGNEILRTDASGAGMFSAILTVPGTSGVPWLNLGWSAQWWKEGHVVLQHPTDGDSRSLTVMHHADSPSPRETTLFTLPEDLHGSITAWSLEADGTLWVMHHELTPDSVRLIDMLRVTGLPLGTGMVNELPAAPAVTALYPHPLHGEGTMELHLPVAGTLRLAVYDLSGRQVARLPDRGVQPGVQRISLDLLSLVPGTYVIQGELGHGIFRKVIVLQ
jgi:hypothetical protein